MDVPKSCLVFGFSALFISLLFSQKKVLSELVFDGVLLSIFIF